jgi:hypothetical protein
MYLFSSRVPLPEGGQIWWMYLVLMYGNRTMKPIEIVLIRRERG